MSKFSSVKICLSILPFLLHIFVLGNLYSDPVTSDLCYSIQVASYEMRSNALNAIESFKKLDMDTFLQPKEIPGRGQMYRIYIGRYSSKGEAKMAAEQLKSKKLIENYYCRLIKRSDIITYYKPVIIEPAAYEQPQDAEREDRTEQDRKISTREDNSTKKRNHALGRVLAAEDDHVYVIDLGESDGLENGDTLYVFPKVITEGETGAIRSEPVATLKIKKVAHRWIKGKVIDSNGKIKPYYAVKVCLKSNSEITSVRKQRPAH